MRLLTPWLLVPVLLAASPLASAAEEHCRHSAPRALDLDLAGARTVRFEVRSNTLRLKAAPGTAPSLVGRACASDADLLESLKLSQHREGDLLVVSLEHDSPVRITFGNRYSHLDIDAAVPDHLQIQMIVGSGDVWSDGGKVVSVDVGSGDADVRNVGERLFAKVGSGDLGVHDIGALNLLALGSGDVEGSGIRGAVSIGSIGSGDVDLSRIGGSVKVGRIGSGDVGLSDVTGSVEVEAIGSGELDLRGVGGNFILHRKGSGDVSHRDVRGTVTLPRRD